MRKLVSTKSGRVLAAGACALGLVAAAAPVAYSAGGDNLTPSTATVSPDDKPGKTRWAVVNADGTVDRGRGVASATNLGTGAYEVIFNRNVRNCVYVATIGLSTDSGTELPSFITTVGRAGNDNGVYVATSDVTGSSANRGFHMYVSC